LTDAPLELPRRLAGLDASVLLQGTGIFEEFKGSLTEQYVLQQIVAARSNVPMYWAPDDAKAELDFSIEQGNDLIPSKSRPKRT
jgi:uncharacterized protein